MTMTAMTATATATRGNPAALALTTIKNAVHHPVHNSRRTRPRHFSSCPCTHRTAPTPTVRARNSSSSSSLPCLHKRNEYRQSVRRFLSSSPSVLSSFSSLPLPSHPSITNNQLQQQQRPPWWHLIRIDGSDHVSYSFTTAGPVARFSTSQLPKQTQLAKQDHPTAASCLKNNSRKPISSNSSPSPSDAAAGSGTLQKPNGSSKDYQSMAINRIESIGDYQESLIDTTQLEVSLERLTETNDGNPNLLLNVLEMALMQNVQQHQNLSDLYVDRARKQQLLEKNGSDANQNSSVNATGGKDVSLDIVYQVFQKIVQSKHIKLLERAESTILYQHFPNNVNLMKLLIEGYIQAGEPESAAELFLNWTKNTTSTTAMTMITKQGRNQGSDRHLQLSGLRTYRSIITELAKRRDYELAYQVLSTLCSQYEEAIRMEETKSDASSGSTDDQSITILSPDRDLFHRVLSACTTPESIIVANDILDSMIRYCDTYGLETEPTYSTFELFTKVWLRAASANPATNVSPPPPPSSLTPDISRDHDSLTTYYDYDWILDFFRQTEHNKNSATPEISCWNLVIDLMAERGEYKMAESVLHRLLTDYVKGDSSVRPDNITVNTVFKSHLVSRTVDAAESATSLSKKLADFQLIQHKQQLCRNDDTSLLAGDSELGMSDETERPNEENVGRNVLSIDDSEPSTSRESPLLLTARGFASIQALWCKLGHPERAIQVLEDSERLYREALSQVDKNNAKQARWINSLLKPDEIAYNTIVAALSKTNPPTVKAAETAERLLYKNMRAMNHTPNTITCNAVLNCWTSAGHPHKAESFLRTMMTDLGLQPDTASFNTVISGHANAGDCQRALEVLHSMLRDNFQDRSLDGKGDSNEMKNAFLGNVGITIPSSLRLPRPNTRTFTAILVALSRENTVEAAKQAEELLSQMDELSKEPYHFDTLPNAFSYNAVLNCWCSIDRNRNGRKGKKVSQLAEKRAESIIETMKKLPPPQQPTVVTYNTMIKGYGDSLKKAERCVDEMISRGIEPNQSTYKQLMKVLQRDRFYSSQEAKTAKAIEIQQFYQFSANGLPRRRPTTAASSAGGRRTETSLKSERRNVHQR